jgi:hypothetical protein
MAGQANFPPRHDLGKLDTEARDTDRRLNMNKIGPHLLGTVLGSQDFPASSARFSNNPVACR